MNGRIRGGDQKMTRYSITVAVLVGLFSVLSLAAGDLVYADVNLFETFRPNDAINLILGLPALFLGLHWRETLAGKLLWAGALLMLSYNGLVAVLSLPVGWPLLVQLVIVLISAGTAIRILARMDRTLLTERLEGRVAETFTGGILALFGLAFAARAIWHVFGAPTDFQDLPQTQFALMLTDILFGAIWAISGILLVLRRAVGYPLAGGSLVQAGLLFVALDLFLIIEPAFTDTPRMAEDLVATLVMTLLFAVPVGIFIRGATRTD